MSSKDKGNKSCRKKQVAASKEVKKQSKEGGSTSSNETAQNNLNFSKLLDGVVLVLSGFVNPERSTLRSQALEMGAEYRADWTSDCTLLVCAFPNTPKFRQVGADCGTIVSKEWISDCYQQKQLVDIECYLMHAGRPWRKCSRQIENSQEKKNALPDEPLKQVETRSHARLTGFAVSEEGVPNIFKDHFSRAKIKKWAIDDLNKTISWLESQEEKPELNEVKTIAAEGIVTCLQDAIESLRNNQDVQHVVEQWKFVPRVVKELAEFEGRRRRGSLSKEELSELVITCKKIYEDEFDHLDDSLVKIKKRKTDADEEDSKDMQIKCYDAGSDSDQTIEMTEEEIDLACKNLSENYEW
ncbi:DNA-repair protein XRCC1 isoform X1 [Elaeis guineensis]|uniref:DNA-repair protein XRCC1 isoform X1 n=2 Tax=Elaeis guineensis var. tenera TaxID=51953 RepID=A0A6I9RFA7_ELAGV|nr:DNA-repair protein XRCC1 isoform X1 [Elaeis guineensis]XP_010925302.1 DNA-repair protein XRCC1 isoform X1 [Elaeis guineensis]XP_019707482.1 DNA-repair protein XRCC1 isoform X1 [Elaeis guineensis]